MATSKKSQKSSRLNKQAKKGVINNVKSATSAKRTGKKQTAVMVPEDINRAVTITVSGHAASQATRVMEMLQVQSIVRIRIRTDVETNPRAATYTQLEELESYIREQVLCRMPFPKGQGQIIYCRHDASFTDECTLSSYQAVLDAVLGKGRVHARIYRMSSPCDYE